jgi:hypothetical protein
MSSDCGMYSNRGVARAFVFFPPGRVRGDECGRYGERGLFELRSFGDILDGRVRDRQELVGVRAADGQD